MGAVTYGPTERAAAVVCKVTGSGKNWTLHTDIGTFSVDVSYIHGKLDPESLASQIQPNTEYELTYYGPEGKLGPWTSHPNVVDAQFIRGNAHSDAPICND